MEVATSLLTSYGNPSIMPGNTDERVFFIFFQASAACFFPLGSRILDSEHPTRERDTYGLSSSNIRFIVYYMYVEVSRGQKLLWLSGKRLERIRTLKSQNTVESTLRRTLRTGPTRGGQLPLLHVNHRAVRRGRRREAP